ncbi:hypothetical protein AAE02nite_36230 [Adhaeribacter aerolatus]|uniref:DUF4062 domain-containing protein n=1 Tax=Adhaeribacter aerolatus TaxID=670289 RepID=A0A512B1Z3_9BACT|nr:DUF4062 domain-containing protein [Adhaeribacter aerolatus]GEO05959.1 hypothetical protein AAE02nite_36230 [Adhaeribacter aerolatus]
MALLKVFVSSTCYDLNIVRGQLRASLQALGHEPVMSDYNDVLFDPRSHTHESCIKEIANADVVILIIGSRFGGTAIPKAVNSLDIDSLKSMSKGNKILEAPNKISITQLEIFKAIESSIPIFTFIDSKVLHDHLFYEKNKDKGILDSLEFPSIEKKESAVFIFEFINFLRLRSKNNSLVEFSRLADIEEYLRKQWSALFQRLLFEQRIMKSESRRLDAFSEELKDIKSLILSSISVGQAKEVGRGVLRYRRLIDFLNNFIHPNIQEILLSDISWEELLKCLDIKELKVVELNSGIRPTVYLVKTDGTFYITRYPIHLIQNIANEWKTFKNLATPVKQEVVAALTENLTNSSIGGPVSYRNKQLEDYLRERTESTENATIITATTISPNTMSDSGITTEEE